MMETSLLAISVKVAGDKQQSLQILIVLTDQGVNGHVHSPCRFGISDFLIVPHGENFIIIKK